MLRSKWFVLSWSVPIIAVLAWLTVGVAPALAYQGDPMTIPENQSLVQSLLEDISNLPSTPSGTNPATGSAYTADEVATGITAAEESGGIIASLPELGTILMGGAALYTGWRIGTADVASGQWIYRKITGDTGLTGISTSSPTWTSYCATAASGPNGLGCGSTGFSSAGWSGGANLLGASGVYGPGWLLGGTTVPGANIFCTTTGLANGCARTTSTETGWANQIVASSTAQEVDNDASAGTGCTTPGWCMIVIRTFKQMQTAVKVQASTSTAYNSANRKDAPTVTTHVVTQTDLNHAERTCGGFLGTATGTASQEACRAAVNLYVSPTWSRSTPTAPSGGTTSVVSGGGTGASFTPFVFPQPDINETYTQYIARLRDKGWVGTAHVTTPGSTTSGLGPKAVIDVQDTDSTATGGTTVTPTLTWPDNPPTVTGSGDNIYIDANSPSASAVAVPPAISGSGCQCPAVDFTPLEGISLGSKFPFGAFTWFTNELGTIPTSGTPIDIALSRPAGVAGGTIHLNFQNTDWETTYRPIVFPIIEIFMTLAMFYGFATRVLGLGDAGEIGD